MPSLEFRSESKDFVIMRSDDGSYKFEAVIREGRWLEQIILEKKGTRTTILNNAEFGEVNDLKSFLERILSYINPKRPLEEKLKQ